MDRLRALNPHLPMHHVADRRFAHYGRVLTGFDFLPWLDYLDQHKVPETFISRHFETFMCVPSRNSARQIIGPQVTEKRKSAGGGGIFDPSSTYMSLTYSLSQIKSPFTRQLLTPIEVKG